MAFLERFKQEISNHNNKICDKLGRTLKGRAESCTYRLLKRRRQRPNLAKFLNSRTNRDSQFNRLNLVLIKSRKAGCFSSPHSSIVIAHPSASTSQLVVELYRLPLASSPTLPLIHCPVFLLAMEQNNRGSCEYIGALHWIFTSRTELR